MSNGAIEYTKIVASKVCKELPHSSFEFTTDEPRINFLFSLPSEAKKPKDLYTEKVVQCFMRNFLKSSYKFHNLGTDYSTVNGNYTVRHMSHLANVIWHTDAHGKQSITSSNTLLKARFEKQDAVSTTVSITLNINLMMLHCAQSFMLDLKTVSETSWTIHRTNMRNGNILMKSKPLSLDVANDTLEKLQSLLPNKRALDYVEIIRLPNNTNLYTLNIDLLELGKSLPYQELKIDEPQPYSINMKK